MSKRLRADLSLAFCSLLWDATFVVVKNALGYSSALIFLAVRFSVAADAALEQSDPPPIRTRRPLRGTPPRHFMFLDYAFQTTGLQYTTPTPYPCEVRIPNGFQYSGRSAAPRVVLWAAVDVGCIRRIPKIFSQVSQAGPEKLRTYL
jgi:hypothetical protein